MRSPVPTGIGRRLARAVVGAAVVVLPMAVPAVADAATPCSEQVCLFDSQGRFVGAYQEITDDPQLFGTGRTAYAVNGFDDEAVYFVYDGGRTSCIQPKREASVQIAEYGPVRGLQIRPGGNCYPGGSVQ